MHTEKEAGAHDGLKAVRMYPNNQLRAQVRDIKETLSAFSVVKATYFQAK